MSLNSAESLFYTGYYYLGFNEKILGRILPAETPSYNLSNVAKLITIPRARTNLQALTRLVAITLCV